MVLFNISRIFKECPSPFETITVVHIHDCEAIYSFFSSDGRYVPLCKKCNASTYILTRFPNIKVYCSNPKCKLKIICEDKIEGTETKKKIISRQKTSSSRQDAEKSEVTRKSGTSSKGQRFYSKHEL